jgi:hypothetical protein
MVRVVNEETGAVWHKPPYTWEEEQDFYRRVGCGPVAIVRPAPQPRPSPPAQQPEE